MGGVIADSSSEYRLPLQFRPCINKPNLYKSIFDGSYLVHYQKLIRSKGDLANQYQQFQFRKCHCQQILSPQYFSSDTVGVCSLNTKVHFFFNNIESTIAEIPNFQNIVQAFIIIIDCLKGAQILARKYGYFQIRSEMIFCINGKAKIWINQNPLQVQVRQKVYSKKEFVLQIIQIIDSKITKNLFQEYLRVLRENQLSQNINTQTLIVDAKLIKKGLFSCILSDCLRKEEQIETIIYVLLKKMKQIQGANSKSEEQKIENISIIEELNSQAHQNLLSNREIIIANQKTNNRNVLGMINQNTNAFMTFGAPKQNKFPSELQCSDKWFKQNEQVTKYITNPNSLSSPSAKCEGQNRNRLAVLNSLNKQNIRQCSNKNNMRFSNLDNNYRFPSRANNQINHFRNYSEVQHLKPEKFSLKFLDRQAKDNSNENKKSWQSIYNNIPLQTKLMAKAQQFCHQEQNRQTLNYKMACYEQNVKKEDRRTIKTNSRKNSDMSANQNSYPSVSEVSIKQQQTKKVSAQRCASMPSQLSINHKASFKVNQSKISEQIQQMKNSLQQPQNKSSSSSIQKVSNATKNVEQEYIITKCRNQICQSQKECSKKSLSFQARCLSRIQQQQSNFIVNSDREQGSDNMLKDSQKRLQLLKNENQSEKMQSEKAQPSSLNKMLQKSQLQEQNASNFNMNYQYSQSNNKRTSIQSDLMSKTLKVLRSESASNQNFKDSNDFSNLVTTGGIAEGFQKFTRLKKSRFSHHVNSSYNTNKGSNMVKIKGSRQSQKVSALKRFTVIEKQGQDPLVIIKQTQLMQLMKNMVKTRSPFRKLTTIESIPGTQQQQYSYIDEGQEYDQKQQSYEAPQQLHLI